MAQKHYPCDDEPFICPFYAYDGDSCRHYCGLGVDENEPEDFRDYEEDDDNGKIH